ncbi:Unknown protein sequence [Pseudomonas syringae pv. cilantro]|uniref:Uncharacterized protein n=1 Tax=Pseudomonas syringae pv. cilantro TaxID=81035 RepID=A0A0N0GFN1_PSESX|nr:Unknown protein sequence [Pseudomonas syringae pv. cilantro]
MIDSNSKAQTAQQPVGFLRVGKSRASYQQRVGMAACG